MTAKFPYRKASYRGAIGSRSLVNLRLIIANDGSDQIFLKLSDIPGVFGSGSFDSFLFSIPGVIAAPFWTSRFYRENYFIATSDFVDFFLSGCAEEMAREFLVINVSLQMLRDFLHFCSNLSVDMLDGIFPEKFSSFELTHSKKPFVSDFKSKPADYKDFKHSSIEGFFNSLVCVKQDSASSNGFCLENPDMPCMEVVLPGVFITDLLYWMGLKSRFHKPMELLVCLGLMVPSGANAPLVLTSKGFHEAGGRTLKFIHRSLGSGEPPKCVYQVVWDPEKIIPIIEKYLLDNKTQR